MVDIKNKEKNPTQEAPIQPSEIPQAPEIQPEQSTTIEKDAELIPTPDKAVEVPEQQVEQVQEQITQVEDASQQQKPPQVSPLMNDEEVMQDLKDVMAMDKPKQVKVLVYLAFKKGIHHAANIAKKLKDPYLMDEFHDTLVSELYSLLLKKRKIKKK